MRRVLKVPKPSESKTRANRQWGRFRLHFKLPFISIHNPCFPPCHLLVSIGHKEGEMPWNSSLRSAHLGSTYSHTSWALTFLRPSVKLFCSQTVPLWANCQCQVMLPGFSSDYTLLQCKWGMLFKMLSLFFYHSGSRHERIKKPQDYFLLWIVEKATNLWLTRDKRNWWAANFYISTSNPISNPISIFISIPVSALDSYPCQPL